MKYRRDRHRRRPQRPDGRRLSRARRAQGARARAPARGRRRGRHRRDLSRLQVLGLLVRRLAAAAGDHPRARSAAARPGDPAARRHVHADAERRLPVARERPRARRAARSRATRSSTPRPTTNTARRWSRWRRFVKPILDMTPPDPMSLDPRELLELAVPRPPVPRRCPTTTATTRSS